MVTPPAEPGATADTGAPEAGSTRKLLLDEMLAEREHAPLPPAPVLTLQPVPVDAAPVGAGRKGALKRLAEVEALARTNLRAAEEPRRAHRVSPTARARAAPLHRGATRRPSPFRRDAEGADRARVRDGTRARR